MPTESKEKKGQKEELHSTILCEEDIIKEDLEVKGEEDLA